MTAAEVPASPNLAHTLRLRPDVWRRRCAARGAFILDDKAALIGSDSAWIGLRWIGCGGTRAHPST